MLDLSERTMLANLTIKMWCARKLDRKVTDKTNQDHGAKADAGRYNKALISAKALEPLIQTSGAARRKHAALTLPWLDDGSRILTTIGLDSYSREMRNLREEFEGEVDSFLATYAKHVTDARGRLGDMFNEADYPEIEEVRRRFGFDIALMPVAMAGDFRAEIDADLADGIRQDIERRTRDAIAEANRDAWRRVMEAVSHMAERLKAYKPGEKGKRAEGVFKETLVTNVKELVSVLPALDITGEGELAAIAARLERDLCQVDAKTLRENDNARVRTAERAAAIVAEVQQFMA